MEKNNIIKSLISHVDDRILIDTLSFQDNKCTVNMDNGQKYSITYMEKDDKSTTISLLSEDEVIIGRAYFDFIYDYTKEQITSNFKVNNGMLVQTINYYKEKGIRHSTMRKETMVDESTDIKLYQIQPNMGLEDIESIKPKLVSVKRK